MKIKLKILVAVVVYDRMDNINLWLLAWKNAQKYRNAKILVVHNLDNPNYSNNDTIAKWKPDFYWQRKNEGMDIGAFKDVIDSNKFGDWNILFWCVDDNLPVDKYFLRRFIKPFETNRRLGLVANHWVNSDFYERISKYGPMPDHFRTTCFAIRREVAEKLKFPRPLETKVDCYKFEWLDLINNLTEQISRLGYQAIPVDKSLEKSWTECNEYIWDTGSLQMDNPDPRCRKDLWNKYLKQFKQT